jgi:RNA polymerase sigma factor (sigma-70 family)
MDELDLGTLVRDAARGDEQAWAALVNRFAGLVWAVARGHGLDHADAADISQTTWLRLAEQLSFIRDPDRLGAWLATTARRESLRTLRRHERHVSVEECVDWVCGDIALELTDSLESRERDAALWSAFEDLSGNCKALLRALLADPPPSYAVLSDLFEMPIGSIGPTRARCLDRLRDRIAPLPERPKRRRTVGSTAKRSVS